MPTHILPRLTHDVKIIINKVIIKLTQKLISKRYLKKSLSLCSLMDKLLTKRDVLWVTDKVICRWLVGHLPVTWHDEVMWPTSARNEMLLSVWQYGGRLVKINDEATNEFIARTLNGLWWRNRGVWIGLHDRHVELRWQWVGKTRCKHVHTYIQGALKTTVSRCHGPQQNGYWRRICFIATEVFWHSGALQIGLLLLLLQRTAALSVCSF